MKRITAGRAALTRHGGTLRAIEGRYGVPTEVLTAIWGLEFALRHRERRYSGHFRAGHLGL